MLWVICQRFQLYSVRNWTCLMCVMYTIFRFLLLNLDCSISGNMAAGGPQEREVKVTCFVLAVSLSLVCFNSPYILTMKITWCRLMNCLYEGCDWWMESFCNKQVLNLGVPVCSLGQMQWAEIIMRLAFVIVLDQHQLMSAVEVDYYLIAESAYLLDKQLPTLHILFLWKRFCFHNKIQMKKFTCRKHVLTSPVCLRWQESTTRVKLKFSVHHRMKPVTDSSAESKTS